MIITEVKPIQWRLSDIWNAAAFKEDKPLKARNYMYASELGLPLYDRYLKMNAVAYTNPPNLRSRRKFLAGNLFEHITKMILVSTGIFHSEENKIDAQPYPSGLEVHGKCDFVAGGYIDPVLATYRLDNLHLPDYLHNLGERLIAAFAERNLERLILELKSCSSFVLDRVSDIGRPLAHHGYQAYHYDRNGPLRAQVGYLCKDDMRMEQFPLDAKEMEPLYEDDILKMSTYYKKKKTPPLAPVMSFNMLTGRFEKNIMVEYSPYLTHYGFTSPEAFRQSIGYLVSWNRVLSRYVQVELKMKTPTNKPIDITSKNKAVRADIEKAGFKFKDLIATKIKLGAVDEPPQEEES